MAVQTGKAQLGQPPTLLRNANRLQRIRLNADSIQDQLDREQYETEATKRQAMKKLKALRDEESKLTLQLAELRNALNNLDLGGGMEPA